MRCLCSIKWFRRIFNNQKHTTVGMTTGYNMECDPGSLFTRTCYIIDSSGNRNEIIGYDDNDNPVTKSPTTAAGAAWEPQIFTLNQDGTQFQPYKGGSIPFGYLNFTPSTGADPQDFYYMNYVMPGAEAYRKQQTYVGGWWENIFGLRQEPPPAELAEGDVSVSSMTDSVEANKPMQSTGFMSGLVKTASKPVVQVSAIGGALVGTYLLSKKNS